MKKILFLILILSAVLMGLFFIWEKMRPQVAGEQTKVDQYWFILYRDSNKEELYKGVPGDKSQSTLIKTFSVKTGIDGEKPTPLPELEGRSYWNITKKEAVSFEENPETAPYFLTLDIPGGREEPYGPAPYLECDGQCNWELPGDFGLHGVGGDMTKLSTENAGSSGCIRHTDEDITYLYNLLDTSQEIRYYIEKS